MLAHSWLQAHETVGRSEQHVLADTAGRITRGSRQAVFFQNESSSSYVRCEFFDNFLPASYQRDINVEKKLVNIYLFVKRILVWSKDYEGALKRAVVLYHLPRYSRQLEYTRASVWRLRKSVRRKLSMSRKNFCGRSSK